MKVDKSTLEARHATMSEEDEKGNITWSDSKDSEIGEKNGFGPSSEI